MEWLAMGAVLGLATFSIYAHHLSRAASVYGRFRRPRRMTCPMTGEPVFVQLDAARAARTAILSGEPDVRVKGCVQWWNGEKDCKRDCVRPPR